MRLEIDHVIAVVADLEAAAADLWDQHGLASRPGGRHPGHGTGNRIVPLGSSYLELMAVVDPAEATSSPLGAWARRRASDELVPAALCLRTDDIAPIAAVLDERPLTMGRITPDEGRLSWQLAGLDGMLAHGHPFFIQWHCAPEDHPGAAAEAHRVEPLGITSVGIGAIPAGLIEMVTAVPGLTSGGGTGVTEVVISTTSGQIRLAGRG